MDKIYVLYGDEPQLMEEEKQRWLRQWGELGVMTLREEQGPASIASKLQETSLFGDQQILCLVDLPICKSAKKSIDAGWDMIRNTLLDYKGDNPVLILHHDLLDKRMKENKELLAALPHKECKRLSVQDMFQWALGYCKENGVTLDQKGRIYFLDMLDLWQDVPLRFLKTEFDRFFLLLDKKETIDDAFLREHLSDFGEKNIFLFKDALFNKDVPLLMELFPFILQYKQVDRAFSYIEGQLRLQLMVCECVNVGLGLPEIERKLANSSYKPYPIKLAFQASRKIPLLPLAELVRSLYEVQKNHRSGKGTMEDFKMSCLAYCSSVGV